MKCVQKPSNMLIIRFKLLYQLMNTKIMNSRAIISRDVTNGWRPKGTISQFRVTTVHFRSKVKRVLPLNVALKADSEDSYLRGGL